MDQSTSGAMRKAPTATEPDSRHTASTQRLRLSDRMCVWGEVAGDEFSQQITHQV
jgi:hypothetical protein